MAVGDHIIAVLGVRGFPGVQGGVETHCQQLYPRMNQLKFRVYRRKPYLTAVSHTHYENIEFIDWPTTRIQGLEAAWHTLRAAWHCLRHRPALVHVHNMGPALLALPVKLAGVPIVMTYHSVNYEHSKWGGLARWLLRCSERMSLRYCNAIIFVNKARMEHFDEQVQRKSVYIPNGVDRLEPTDETDFLLRHGISPGQYVLAVGRITPEKGFDHLIDAVSRSEIVTQVVIAGDADNNPDYLSRLRKLDSSGKVVFTGYATGEDLRQLYSHARMFVLPSLSEGSPIALLEAMSYGLPIVASDIEATRLMPLPSTCYCPAGDERALLAAVEAKIMMPGNKVDYNLEAYDWDVITTRTLEVYKKVLKVEKSKLAKNHLGNIKVR